MPVEWVVNRAVDLVQSFTKYVIPWFHENKTHEILTFDIQKYFCLEPWINIKTQHNLHTEGAKQILLHVLDWTGLI